MSVQNGQPVNAQVTNAAFVSRTTDTDTIGKLDLKNNAAVSGPQALNIQRLLNSLASALGITTGEVYNFLLTYTSDIVGGANDTVLARLNALTLKFRGTTGNGHKHDGTDGSSEKISATDLLNINQLFAEWQSINPTGVTGSSTVVTSLLTGKTSGGSSVSAGVITSSPSNKVSLFDSVTGQQFEDAQGQKVYGRLTESSGVWTLSYFTNEAGTETAYSFSSSVSIEAFYLEVFTLATRPTIPSTPEFGSLDVTADVVDATSTVRGVVNTGAQAFSGLKTFESGSVIKTLLELFESNNTTTTGADQTVTVTNPFTLLSNASLTSVNGITADTKSRMVLLANKTGAAMTLKHEDSGASANNRIVTPTGLNMTWSVNQVFFFIYDNVNSRWMLAGDSGGSNFSLAAVGSSPNANGATYVPATGAFNLEPANATNPGVVTTAAQAFAGLKTFEGGEHVRTSFDLSIADDSTSGSALTLATNIQPVKRITGAVTSIAGLVSTGAADARHQTIINRTGVSVSILNEDSGATATNRIKTGTGGSITLQPDATLTFVYNSTDSRWHVVGGTGSSQSSGSINLIQNGDADNATTSIFTPYADTGSRPVDGTGGSPTVTTSVTSTSPLTGTKSYLLTKPASNVQGQGWAIPFTVDLSYRAKALKISADYIVDSGTFVAGSQSTDGDLIWYIYDVTNSQLIEPSNIKTLSNSSSLSGKFEATFQTSTTGSSYRLIAHVASTSASAFAIKVDNVTVGPQTYVYGTPVTDWASSSIPLKGQTNGLDFTNQSTTSFIRRVGDSLEVSLFTSFSGAPGAGTGNFEYFLPTGLAIDINKIASSTAFYHQVGDAVANDSDTNRYDGVVVYGSTSSIRILSANGSAAAWSATSPFSFGSGDKISLNFKVPISGWSSSVQMSDSADTRVVDGIFSNSASQTIVQVTNTVLNINTITKDTHGAFNTGNSRYTIPVAGDYFVSGYFITSNSTAATAGGTLHVKARVNGSSIYFMAINGVGTQSCSRGVSGSTIIPNLKVGDYIEFMYYNDCGTNFSTIAGLNAFTISRISGPQAIAASELIACSYRMDTGQTLTVAATVKYNEKIIDTHGSYNTSTGVFTAPASGKYEFAYQGLSINATTQMILALRKNGANQVRASGIAFFQSGTTIVNNNSVAIQVPFQMTLLAGDQVDVFNTVGLGSGTFYASSQDNYLTIKRVG